MSEKKGRITKGHEKILQVDGHIHYLVVISCVYTDVKTYQIVHLYSTVYDMSIIPQQSLKMLERYM